MITVKKILEQYDIVTDKASSHDLYLADLALSGIIEETKIPMIRRSLNKNINEMTVAEKKSLVSLIESLMANVIVEKSGGAMSYPSEKDMPTVIILKRKAIRVFPDNQKIGLYYSQALDRYISIPFGPNAKDLSPQLNEEHQMVRGSKMASKIMTAKNKKEIATRRGEKFVNAQNTLSTRLGAQAGLSLAKLFTKFKDDNPSAVTSVPSTGTKEIPQPWGAAPEEILSQKQTPAVTAPKRGRTIGPGATQQPPKINRPGNMKESFKNNLKIIREKREYGSADAALDAASFLPGPAGTAASLASAGMSLSRGDYTGAALDAAGALPVVGYLAKGAKVAKNVAKAGSEVSKVAKPSRARNIADRVLRGAKNVAKGAAALGAAALSGAGDNDPKVKDPTRRDYEFSGSGRQTVAVGNPQAQQQVLGAGGVVSAQQQAGLYSRIPGMPRSAVNESTIHILKQIVENEISSHQLQIGEETISINKSIAKKIVKLHESLNRTNKKKLERMLNEDVVSFRKVINFALK